MTGKPAISTITTCSTARRAIRPGLSHSFTGTGTSTTLTGLTAGKKYDVQVRANNAETDHTNTPTTDDSPWSDTANAITQSDGVTRSVAENTPAPGNVGAAVTMTAGSYTLAHTLSGTDAGKFEIGSTTGQITVKSKTIINYEKPDGTDHATAPSYSVTVSIAVTGTGNSNSVPNGTGTYTIPVTINVTDVNEPPPKLAAPTLAAGADPATQLNASWTAPTLSQMGTPPVDDYDARYKKTGGFHLDGNRRQHQEHDPQRDAEQPHRGQDLRSAGARRQRRGRRRRGRTLEPKITDANSVTRSVAENSDAGTKRRRARDGQVHQYHLRLTPTP